MRLRELKKKIKKIWKPVKKDLDRILKETTSLAKKGESYFKDISEKSKKKLELLSLSLKKEKLYYQLGKVVFSLPRDRWREAKKVDELISQIRKINHLLKKKKK